MVQEKRDQAHLMTIYVINTKTFNFGNSMPTGIFGGIRYCQILNTIPGLLFKVTSVLVPQMLRHYFFSVALTGAGVFHAISRFHTTT